MSWKLNKLAGAAAIGALILAAPALAQTDTFQGNIISHNGNTIVVRANGNDVTVTLTPQTTVQATKGMTGIRRDDHPQSDLIKGLAVNVETVRSGDELDATAVTFKPDDLKTALAVQAGVAEGREQIIAKQQQNEQRLSQVGQFDQRGKTDVFFATGSATLNSQGKQALQSIATQAAGMPGALLRVVGHADSTGSAAANQKLSDQRASAVAAYLLRDCKVPGEKIVGATGLGEALPVDAEDTSGNQQQNRRVTVFILVSKAAGG